MRPGSRRAGSRSSTAGSRPASLRSTPRMPCRPGLWNRGDPTMSARPARAITRCTAWSSRSRSVRKRRRAIFHRYRGSCRGPFLTGRLCRLTRPRQPMPLQSSRYLCFVEAHGLRSVGLRGFSPTRRTCRSRCNICASKGTSDVPASVFPGTNPRVLFFLIPLEISS